MTTGGIRLRGLPFMTSALEGVPRKQTKVSEVVVNVTVTRGREGVNKSRHFADIKYGSSP